MDNFSNFSSCINNGYLKNKVTVTLSYNKNNIVLLNLLYKNGFIQGYYYNNINNKVIVLLKYFNNKPVINLIYRVSKPGHKIYWTLSKLKSSCYLKNSYYILSTSYGIITSKEALQLGVGGEVLFILS